MKDDSIILQYQESKDPALLETILSTYGSLVKTIAGRLSMTLCNYFELEDLVSFGTFGLLDAIGRFSPNMNASFDTYASLRIKGTIIDEVRKYDSISRTTTDHKKKIEEAKAALSIDTFNITGEMIADKIGISPEEYYKWEYEVETTKRERYDVVFSVSEDGSDECTIKQTTFDEPEDIVEQMTMAEIKNKLKEAMDSLTEKERLVIELFYYEELRQNEIGEIMGVSFSRVSQLHANAINKMRKIMGSCSALVENSAFI